MGNRIEKYIAMVRAKQAEIGDVSLDGTPWDEAERNLDIDHLERVAYQNAQARAFASGVLTQDEAMIVYRSIGEVGSSKNGGWAAGVDYATKVTVTNLIGQLIGVKA
tara:strand:+ start:45 stop:365 length:321 start_codon:yes stop_codon:yes gene_type:complete